MSDRSPPDRSDTDVVGARIGAQLVDLFCMGVQLVVVVFLLQAVLGTPRSENGARGLVVLSLPTLLLYGTVLEGYWNGQTIGKRLLDVRVVDEYGGPCSPGQAAIRNLPAPFIPGWLAYLVALAAMAASDRRQRVFDRAAGTVVVGTRSGSHTGTGFRRAGRSPP